MNIEKVFKKLLIVILFSFLLLPSLSQAGALKPEFKSDIDKNALQSASGYNETTSIGDIMATIIKAFIGLLGIIFIVLIVYAGYSWLTAAGDEAKVTKAKETLQRAVIGLVIVLAAYSITYFVFSNLSNLNGGGSNPP